MKSDPGHKTPKRGSCLVRVANRQRKVTIEGARVEAVAGLVLDALDIQGVEVSVVLVSDQRIRKLNRDYLGRNQPTDVLSFSQREGEGGHLHPSLLGDVIISAETAAYEAEEAGVPLYQELDLLLVHGILHLLGYDHTGSEEEMERMEEAQRRLLLKIKKEFPYDR